jgi:hypothetical protein
MATGEYIDRYIVTSKLYDKYISGRVRSGYGQIFTFKKACKGYVTCSTYNINLNGSTATYQLAHQFAQPRSNSAQLYSFNALQNDTLKVVTNGWGAFTFILYITTDYDLFSS